MKPFDLSPALASITGTYPNLSKVKALFDDALEHHNWTFVRLWLAEGIPYAFKDCPSIYQATREWLANRLRVDPHHISIIGSARLGYSFNPYNLDRVFHEKSDLDYVIVSESLFSMCAEASMRFVTDFEAGAVKAKSDSTQKYWTSDVEYIKRNTRKGFLNCGKVPNFPQYEAIRDVEQRFWELSEKLRETKGCPSFTKATFRIYKNHEAFIKRAALNLDHVLSRSK